ncbi:MAG: UDP-3-O-acyl-N-acetylglucosamine deacetylase [Candidatus Auribacterota bacterium]|jgi:UDP-3-O-acyl N-acetylglucosamine deacetylase|uniref:UDP-3-O-acyl-N-acetylglucosamine deacetylase n=1 Tax=Candidatus Auribacter fodinae TaxID=2093366 RepID=A0A3A4QWL4_9BACT|nr:MAG: UDP-3-O-[3-hydroxymyristoyl] N-acetylglucosamine deacetylase [Candidatus Auribacter fodinae]
MRKQRTIKKEVILSGIGVHTGNRTEMKFIPAEPNAGISFVRTDLPGSPAVKAHISKVVGFMRGTTIGEGDVKVHTVEHVMAPLSSLGVTNVRIELDSNEPPVVDGSSVEFLAALRESGIVDQSEPAEVFELKEPIYETEGDMILVALPYDGFKISYTLSFSHPKLKAQYLSLDINEQSFAKEIAPSRTFCFYREVEVLMNQGLIKGGSLDNAVVIGDDAVFSKEELRFHDEFVRHKILDLVGDTYLLGLPVKAHIIAAKSGHAFNLRLTKKLYEAYLKSQSVHN